MIPHLIKPRHISCSHETANRRNHLTSFLSISVLTLDGVATSTTISGTLAHVADARTYFNQHILEWKWEWKWPNVQSGIPGPVSFVSRKCIVCKICSPSNLAFNVYLIEAIKSPSSSPVLIIKCFPNWIEESKYR